MGRTENQDAVALVLSQIGRVGPLIWYLTPGANLALREIGIVLFLACVGLKSGSRFLDVLISGSGVSWILVTPGRKRNSFILRSVPLPRELLRAPFERVFS
jgi:hypothetical protein